MLLAIDIGNTQTVVGLYKNNTSTASNLHTQSTSAPSPSAMWRLATHKDDTADDIRSRILPLLEAEGTAASALTKAAFASVVPALTHSWQQALDGMGTIDTRFCTAKLATELGLFSTNYPSPHEIGSDRVADVIGARVLYGAPCIVVDFGTATNIDVIDSNGQFCGGIIAPGLQTSASALFANATRLGAIDLVAPPNVIGRSTEEAIQSGIILGEAERADGLIRRVASELGQPCSVVATGGLAPLVAEHSSEIRYVLPELTLEGLRLLIEASSSRV